MLPGGGASRPCAVGAEAEGQLPWPMECMTSEAPPGWPPCSSLFLLPPAAPCLETPGSSFLSRSALATVPSVWLEISSSEQEETTQHWAPMWEGDVSGGKASCSETEPLTPPGISHGLDPAPFLSPPPVVTQNVPHCPANQTDALQRDIHGSALSGLNLSS